ncbi:MAG: hypothetical protein B7Y08_20640 [Rhodospirillales bacterium 24-66-33]|nr:MAG: hypothetical protein B7Y57_22810 [Rhodospirillales bacterium 35-66-84]OYZ92697.1 MAG: hypothetical protein B7Y08_20640 [Rhodospirillales bacterium 24-66-33]OZB24060.1 MAG: hypothetical protein B7X63_17505 [Rhodospirillales bacterium 39-66-50]
MLFERVFLRQVRILLKATDMKASSGTALLSTRDRRTAPSQAFSRKAASVAAGTSRPISPACCASATTRAMSFVQSANAPARACRISGLWLASSALKLPSRQPRLKPLAGPSWLRDLK